MAGYLALLLVDAASTAAVILVPMVLIGVGTGLFFSPNNSLIMSSVPPEKAGLASCMIGTLRQAGYAVGFAVMASLFTLIQDRFELAWTRLGFDHVPDAAVELAEVFDRGGIWSPEVLVYIFHVGAILSAALLIVSADYSWPRVSLAGSRRLLPVAATAGLALGGIALYASASALEIDAEAEASSAAEIPEIAPFGMASRMLKGVAEADQPTLLTGREVFGYFCADCHGLDGGGIPDRGLDLVSSRFVARVSDTELAEFVHRGRGVTDPPEPERHSDAGDGELRRLRGGALPAGSRLSAAARPGLIIPADAVARSRW